jgi:hypothetical protein
MALSPNYSWVEPDNSSLVKNGAQDIRALGDAIDTSVWNIGFGQAGKNKIINGDFGIWQRGTSLSVGGGAYLVDRFSFYQDAAGATKTVSRQAFTPSTEPASGGIYFCRYNVAVAGTGGSNQNNMETNVENVQNFAGQTVTFSFYAKAAAALSVTPRITQYFGSGGSANVSTSGSAIAVTTSWARYTVSFNLASITGKTIGAGSLVGIALLLPGTGTFTFDTWGWQLEQGSKATPFQTASGGSPQAELAMCQRYYYSHVSGSGQPVSGGWNYTTTDMRTYIKFPVTMRISPTTVASSGTNFYTFERAGAGDDFNSFSGVRASTNGIVLNNSTEIVGVAGQAGEIFTSNASSSIAFNSEL